MLLFGLLAAASILNSKLKAGSETYGDVLRREAEDLETKALGYEDGDYWSYDS
jgi:hypothetical protein